MNIELLQQLCEASAVSGDEQEVRDILINTLEPCVNEITFDGLGSFVARKGNKGQKLPLSDIWMKSALWSPTSTRAVFCVLPPLAAGGISRCSTTG